MSKKRAAKYLAPPLSKENPCRCKSGFKALYRLPDGTRGCIRCACPVPSWRMPQKTKAVAA